MVRWMTLLVLVAALGLPGKAVFAQVTIEEVDLQVTSVGANWVTAGGANLTHTFTVTNAGPSDATRVWLDMSQTSSPAGVSIASVTPSGSTTWDVRPDTWIVGSLPVGESRTLTIVYTAAPSAPHHAAIETRVYVDDVDQTLINLDDDIKTEQTTISSFVDFEATVDDDVDPVIAGSGPGNLHYTVTLTNHGPSDAANSLIRVVASLPAGASVHRVRTSQGSYPSAYWSVGTLEPDSTATLTMEITVGPSVAAGADVIDLVAEYPTADAVLQTNFPYSVTEYTDVERRVDLQVNLVDTPDPVIAGSGPNNLTHTVTVTNAGPSDASGVTLSEVTSLPVGVSITSITPSGSTTYAPPDASSGTWTVGDLAAGDSEVLTIAMTVGPSAEVAASVNSTATLTGVNEPKINTGDDAAYEETEVRGRIDLQVSAVDTPDPVTAGSGPSNLTHTVTVTNAGPSDASGVHLSEVFALPTGASLVSITAGAGTTYTPPATSPGIWFVGNLPVGGSKTLTLVCTVGASTAHGATVRSTTTVTTSEQALINTGDDTAIETTTVQQTVDLQVSVLATPDPVTAGSGVGNLTHTITVTNVGPSAATSLTLSEAVSLPPGASVVSITPSGSATYAPAGAPSGTWTVGSLPVGASATLTVVLSVGASAAHGATVRTTTAVASVGQTPIDTGDDSAIGNTTVQRIVDLQVSMLDAPDPVTAGSGAGNLIHTVSVTNTGPSDASGLTLSEVVSLPTGASVASIVPSGSTSYAPADTSPGTWTVSSLPVGATEVLTVVLTVGPSVADGASLSSTATVTGVDETRLNTGDDSASENTTVQRRVDLQVRIVDTADPVTAGSGAGNLTHAVTLRNAGPSDASGLTLSEVVSLPAGVSIASLIPSGTTSYAPPDTSPGTWTVGSLAAGASEVLTVVLTVGTSAADGAIVSSTATLTSANETLLDTGDDTASENTTVQRRVDLQVSTLDTPDPVIAGPGPGNLTHTVTVRNAGPSDASGVELSEVVTLPAGASLDSITPSGATSYAPVGTSPGTWTVGSLPVGASEVLTIVLTVNDSVARGATVSQTATVTASNETRIDTADDTATEDTATILPTRVGLDAQANLQVLDLDGMASNALTLSLVGGNLRIHDPGQPLLAGTSTTQIDPSTVELPLAAIVGPDGIVITVRGGDDTLTLDFGTGNPLPPAPAGLIFDGGTGKDALDLQNGAFGAVQYEMSGPGAGKVLFDGGAWRISYTGLE